MAKLSRRELVLGAGVSGATMALGTCGVASALPANGRQDVREERHRSDLCVVGGGLAGMCAAIEAARHGARVTLMQERPVLGGNSSSEVRMWVCGAHGSNNRETGVLEEIMLENLYRNPTSSYSVWDSVLYEKVRFEPNIELLLNCTCTSAKTDGHHIVSVRGYQTTTQTWHTVVAKLFADCSGDSVLAPLVGAEFRVGREAASELGEDIEPAVADRKTMGTSLLIQTRETAAPVPYVAPDWANRYATDAELPNRGHEVVGNNFWWIEVGGDGDTIADTERNRDELLKIAFGVWDHIKNRGDHHAANWALEWVGFLPGKRESRRYIGDHILTQNDVRAEGRFADLVAYGGWSMDDHNPAGIHWAGPPTIFHPAPAPYGIPYRCLYSRNVDNLWFAGRNISASHAALSSTRVMGTCAMQGHAVGIAAAIAVRDSLSPRGVGQKRIAELQQALMDDDCYLPWHAREIPGLTRQAKITADVGNPEPLRNGHDRPIGQDENAWVAPVGTAVEYEWNGTRPVHEARLTFDSDLDRKFRAGDRDRGANMRCCYQLHDPYLRVPPSLVRNFRIEARNAAGEWTVAAHVENNRRRLVRIHLSTEASAIRVVPESTWGADRVRLFAFDVR